MHLTFAVACVCWVSSLWHIFLEYRKSHKGSRTSKHEFHYTYVQCFKVAGKTICCQACYHCADTNIIKQQPSLSVPNKLH
jgi:hypothetical protein